MSVGLTIDKPGIDQQSGTIVVQLRDALAGIDRLSAYLGATVDADLIALGYTSGEVATLKSSFTDLAKLAAVARGTQTQATAYNVFSFASRLTGLA